LSKSKSSRLYFLAVIALLSASLLVALLPNWVHGNSARLPGSVGQDEARIVKGNEPLGQTVFEGSDVDSQGNVFVGYNYSIYKSVDNGTTFTLEFTIPFQPNPWTLMAGRIWCVYVDSRDYVFVSAISTNRLYRSTDRGASFAEVLNLGRSGNDGGIINMDEDELGSLYACEYGASKSARLFKSSVGGNLGSWSSMRDFDSRHLHNVRINPYNNWLYLATSEDSGLGDTESRSIFRSKDHGALWTRVVQQPSSLSGFVAMEFYNEWVVLGEDNAGGYSSIDRFKDDGNDNLFSTQTVWVNPSITNFYGGTKLGNHLVFATGREGHNTMLCVLESTDSINWIAVDSIFSSSGSDDYRGILSPHPNRNGRIYTCQVAGSAAYYTMGSITRYELTVNSLPILGFSYTVDSQSAVTGAPITLDSGSRTITMPSSITVGFDYYNFAHWEDSSTSPVRTINLQSATVLTATYTKAAAVVDGTISPGEYDGCLSVELVGRTDPNWKVNSYIAWDDEYLYVAVNEHVPATTGHKSWIEFALDAGSARPYLDAFVIFDDHVQSYVRYPKPSGPWSSQGVGSFLVVSDLATEFRVKYTDYGIARGDTIKLAIDRNLGPAPPPPYGFAAFWPQNATVYYGTPPAQPATWGDVYLAPPLQPILYITPSLTTKQFGDVGTTFEVTVMADEMTDLFGFDLNVTWNNNLITFDHASYTPNLDFIWGAGTYEVTKHDAGVEAGTGYYKFVALSLSSSYYGSHALLTLGFMIQDPKTNWKKQTPLEFATSKLSDSLAHPMAHTTIGATYEIFGSTPTLSLSPLTRTCTAINEEFEVAVVISGCESVTGFNFEIHFNTTLLDYVSGIVNPAYGTGTMLPDEGNGKVTGTTTGSASGSLTLVTIRLKTAFNHMWKDENTIQGWRNIATGDIYIQSATLRYSSPQPDRAFTRGGTDNKINVGPDVLYTWSPIQGDVNLDGDVDIIDLRYVSTFYDGINAELNLTGASNLIDIFDLVVIAGNFGF
jgi:hypothetical protein